MADKNLMYRKTVFKNIYNLSKLFDELMEYEKCKYLIFNNLESDFKYFSYLKGLYKAHKFILNTDIKHYNPLVLNILYNLMFNKNLDKELRIDLIKFDNFNEDLVDNIINLIKYIHIQDDYERYIFSYVIIAYLIYCKINKLYRFSNSFFKKLYEVVNQTKNYDILKKHLQIEMEKEIFPDPNYFDNLKVINPDEIKTFLKDNQELFKEKYKITSIYLYGSFIKGTYRIDSDIDMAGVFIDDIGYEEKLKLVMQIKETILNRFNRYCDFMEYSTTLLKNEKHIKIY